MNPSVSFVIVGYHSCDALGPCLESIERHAGMPVETIVVDNASGDGTVEWLASAHPAVRVVANDANVGFTRAVNQGLALARGDALFVLNPDCELLPDALPRLVHALRNGRFVGAVAPALVDPRGRVARSCGRFPDLWTLACDHFGLASAFPQSPLFGRYKYGERTQGSLELVGWASGAALLLSRAAYREIGGLDEAIFMYMEEVDWCRRAVLSGFGIRYVPGARVVHVGQQSSRRVPGQTYLHNLRSRVYYFRKHHGPAAAWTARAILVASLAAKWIASHVGRERRDASAIYAAGIGAVREAAWR